MWCVVKKLVRCSGCPAEAWDDGQSWITLWQFGCSAVYPVFVVTAGFGGGVFFFFLFLFFCFLLSSVPEHNSASDAKCSGLDEAWGLQKVLHFATQLFRQQSPWGLFSDRRQKLLCFCPQTKLPPRPDVQRGDPLNAQQWASYFDTEGCIKRLDELKETIFRGVSICTLQVNNRAALLLPVYW